MNYIESKSIIKSNNLIPRKISKKIIKFINSSEKNNPTENIELSKYVSYDDLTKIKRDFQKFKNKTKINNKPRNLSVYKFLKQNFTNKNFQYNKKKNELTLPKIYGLEISLSTLLFRKYNLLENQKELDFKSDFFSKFNLLIKKCNFKKPDYKEIDEFYELLKKVIREKKELAIVTPCCPDYSYTQSDKQNLPYEFNFEKILNGHGLVAKRLFEDANSIHNFLKSLNIRFKHYVTVGDFEAYSQKNQNKLGISESEYLDKVEVNQKKIKELFNLKNCVADKLFTKIFGDKKKWLQKVNYYHNQIGIKKGYLDIMSEEKFENILNSRVSLYKKWYGELNTKEFRKILYSQASEYAAMGELIKEKFDNCLIIGADHHKMSNFYKFNKVIVFYLKKNYKT